MKKIKLLRDAFHFKAGTIFYLDGDKFYPMPVRGSENKPFLDAKVVAQSMDWFEELSFKRLELDDNEEDCGTINIGGERYGLSTSMSGAALKRILEAYWNKNRHEADREAFEHLSRPLQYTHSFDVSK